VPRAVKTKAATSPSQILEIADIGAWERVVLYGARFMELSPDLLAVAGFDGYLKRVTPRWEQVLGYSQQELLASPLIDFVHPDDRERTDAAIRELASGAELTDLELRLRRRDGFHRLFLWSAKAALEEEAIYAVGKDVTDRWHADEALREAEDRFRSAFEDAPIGMALLSLERGRIGCFLRVNRALCEITGHSTEHLVGTDLDEVTHPEDHRLEQHYLPWTIAGETPRFEVEKRLVHADGRSLWCLLSVSAVHDSQGRPLYLIAQLQDITERKNAQDALWESRERLQATIDNATAPIYLKDHDGRFLLVNRRFELLAGLDRGEIIGKPGEDLFRADVADAIQEGDRDVLQTGIPIQSEEVVGQPDGAHTYVSIKFPLFDPDGVPQGIGSISTDITERKRAEDALKESEERFRQIVNTANEAFVSIDSEGRIAAWNPAAETTFGWPASEVLGKSLAATIIPPRYRQAHERGLRQFLTTGRAPLLGRRVEIEALHREGHEFPVELTISAMRVGDGYVFNAFLHDITERKRAEQLVGLHHEITLVLAQAPTIEDALLRLLETIAKSQAWRFGAFWGLEEDSGAIRCRATWHPASFDPGGFERSTLETAVQRGSELVGRVWEGGQTEWREKVDSGEATSRAEAAARSGLGSAICIPVKSERQVVGVMEFYSDELSAPDEDLLEALETIGSQVGQFIERKNAEEALREIQEGFRSAFEDAPIGMALMSVAPESPGHLLQVNRALADLTGYSEERLRAIDLSSLTHPDDREREQPLIQKLLAGGIPHYHLEQRYLRADGSPVWVMLNASTVHNSRGKLLYGIAQVQDISERKQAEESLARAAAELERHAAELERSNADLQQFAYVASHDLSEPLRMVSSYVQLLARRYEGKLDSDADDFIGFAVDGTVRMQALIDGLLMYSRAGTADYSLVPVDCSEVARQALAMLEARVRDTDADVTIDELPTVQGDPTQLAQLFQNLIGNAIKFVSDKQPHVHVSAEREPGAWRFGVTDNGIGIEPRHMERIFAVFQRLHSREAYSGSGVGLAICKRIVERHGGRIWVESTPGQGSTFYFTIPDGGG